MPLAAAEEELRGLYETAKEKMGEQEAEIFDAHLTILGDEYSVREPIIQRIREQKQNAAAAIEDQFDELAQMFRSLGDELMAERAADAEDLKQQLLRSHLVHTLAARHRVQEARQEDHRQPVAEVAEVDA